MNTVDADNFLNNLDRFPLFLKYLGPSLRERLGRAEWFENRFIRDMYLDASFVERYENLLKNAHIDEVENSNLIFEVLNGNNMDYDLELFDVLAEIRLICWARENGYKNIEKLSAISGQTPDFSMDKLRVKTLAEAKHFRTRDYLLDFVYDRVGGLLVVTGQYTEIHISIKTTSKYTNSRGDLVRQTAEMRSEQIQKAREEIPHDFIERMVKTGTRQTNLLGGLITVEITQGPGLGAVHSTSWHNDLETSNIMIDKLEGNLYRALEQIRDYKNSRIIGQDLRGLVFLSGTSPQEKEWDVLWDMLFKYKDDNARRRIIDMKQKSQEMVDIPFDLIVEFGIPSCHYPSFSLQRPQFAQMLLSTKYQIVCPQLSNP